MFSQVTVELAQGLGTITKPTNSIIKADANQSIISIVTVFVTAATTIAGVIFLVMLVIGGLRWILGGGDKASLESARNQITNAAIGLGIVVAALAITFVVQTALGINILNPRLGP